MKFKKHNILYLNLAQLIQEAIQKSTDDLALNLDQIYLLLSTPPKKDMGDVAFACFGLAKALKKSPAQIAQDLLECLNESRLVLKSKNFGPYLNFYINPAEFNKIILDEILSESFFKSSLVEIAPKTTIEYSQPNTHKELHVGHMRNMCLGNAIVNLYRYVGIETHATTFPGDVGTHVAKCLWYYKKYNTEQPPTIRQGAWLGKLYTKANLKLEDEKGSENEEKNRAELTAILKQLHDENGEYYTLWQETKKWSLTLMQEVYAWANITFDSWYWESDVDSTSVALINKYFEKGLFIKDQGAIGIDLSDDKLGFCLLLKSDGTGLYATKDLELARRKFEDQDIEKSIYVVDNRQSLHFKQVFKTLEKMGFENAKNCFHLQYEMVELPDGAMSSRKGNIVPIQKLIDEMVTKIKIDYLNKYVGDWHTCEIDTVANQVAAGAIKYGMTRIDSNKKIVFDMDEWLKLDGESGPYIQYVHARINSLVSKIKRDPEIQFELLTHELESDLILKLSKFNTIIENCVTNNKTHPLCSYLYELAKAFNSFYAECSVLKAETHELVQARTALADGVAIIIRNGLSLLGIDAPKKM
ncbi:MAG: arginine--tRNA ligase [Halobacteriovoraceae bacterium]|jgi:arginyl-tRNA synthetase|nr:arginine--tRNA ligase [Halobacteriovoraceae bacterium]